MEAIPKDQRRVYPTRIFPPSVKSTEEYISRSSIHLSSLSAEASACVREIRERDPKKKNAQTTKPKREKLEAPQILTDAVQKQRC